jgi:apolipoprotein N-acyltransferase
MTQTHDVRLWLLSAIGGVFAALAFITLGTRGLAVALLLALLAVVGQRRALKAAGALAGAGAATLVILTLAISRCLESSTYLGQSCIPASLTFAMPFVTLALLIGVAFTIRSLSFRIK